MSQTTIMNHLSLRHVLTMGNPHARYQYILDPEREKDQGFFKALALKDLEPGVEIKIRRGDFDVTQRCKNVGAETADWEKVTA